MTGGSGIDHRSLLQGMRFHPVHVASRCIQQLEHVPEFQFIELNSATNW